jgi:hypothetical protein
MDSYRELLNHFSTAHTGRWPWADREGLTRVHPGLDASIGYDLSELTIKELVDLWTDLEADALQAIAAGLTVPPPTTT